MFRGVTASLHRGIVNCGIDVSFSEPYNIDINIDRKYSLTYVSKVLLVVDHWKVGCCAWTPAIKQNKLMSVQVLSINQYASILYVFAFM